MKKIFLMLALMGTHLQADKKKNHSDSLVKSSVEQQDFNPSLSEIDKFSAAMDDSLSVSALTPAQIYMKDLPENLFDSMIKDSKKVLDISSNRNTERNNRMNKNIDQSEDSVSQEEMKSQSRSFDDDHNTRSLQKSDLSTHFPNLQEEYGILSFQLKNLNDSKKKIDSNIMQDIEKSLQEVANKLEHLEAQEKEYKRDKKMVKDLSNEIAALTIQKEAISKYASDTSEELEDLEIEIGKSLKAIKEKIEKIENKQTS